MNSVNLAGNAIRELLITDRLTVGGWEELVDLEHNGALKEGGSGNYAMLGNCVATLAGTVSKIEAVASWKNLFEVSKDRFMLNEPFSVIYQGWHAVPVLVVYHWAKLNGEAELQAMARNWLLQYVILGRILSGKTPSGREYTALCGMRSTGVPVDNWAIQHAFIQASKGADVDWSNKRDARYRIEETLRDFDSWKPAQDVWIEDVLFYLRYELAEAVKEVWEAGDDWDKLWDLFPKYTLYAGLGCHVIRTESECGMILSDDNPETDDDPNPHTLGLLAIVLDLKTGEVRSLPEVTPEGLLGPHYRGGGTRAVVWHNPTEGKWSYVNEDLGISDVIDSPKGTPLVYWRLGSRSRKKEDPTDGTWKWRNWVQEENMSFILPPPELPELPPIVYIPPKPKRKSFIEVILNALFGWLRKR